MKVGSVLSCLLSDPVLPHEMKLRSGDGAWHEVGQWNVGQVDLGTWVGGCYGGPGFFGQREATAETEVCERGQALERVHVLQVCAKAEVEVLECRQTLERVHVLQGAAI